MGVARAADLPLKAAPLPAPIYTWTDFYVGLNAGYGLAEDPFSQTITSAGLTESSSINSRVTPNGAIAGGQIGYNYQSDHIVVGVEGDFQWSGQRDTAGCGIECINGAGLAATVGFAAQNIKWFGTARGRLGWADNGWLLYVTGGARGPGSTRPPQFPKQFQERPSRSRVPPALPEVDGLSAAAPRCGFPARGLRSSSTSIWTSAGSAIR
jgi:opacity protein-like surface antigen